MRIGVHTRTLWTTLLAIAGPVRVQPACDSAAYRDSNNTPVGAQNATVTQQLRNEPQAAPRGHRQAHSPELHPAKVLRGIS